MDSHQEDGKLADCLTKHLTLDEETQSIRDLLQTGRMHLRYTDEGVERTLTDEQRKSEALEFSAREQEMRAVPAEMDSEDEASFSQSMPPRGANGGGSGSGSGRPGASALSKHTGVGKRPKKTLAVTADAKAAAAPRARCRAVSQQHTAQT